MAGGSTDVTMAMQPQVGFSLAHRDAAEKVFLSVDHEKCCFGKDSPGTVALTNAELKMVWGKNHGPACAMALAVPMTPSISLPYPRGRQEAPQAQIKPFLWTGPSAYMMAGSLGRQMCSDNNSAPAWRQSTEKRFQYDFVKRAASAPGPGQYTVPSAVAKQVRHCKERQRRPMHSHLLMRKNPAEGYSAQAKLCYSSG